MPIDKPFTLKKWNSVAMWKWHGTTDICTICQSKLTELCHHCLTEDKGEQCAIVWGECNHVFHNCCISVWVNKNSLCPLCQKPWIVERIG